MPRVATGSMREWDPFFVVISEDGFEYLQVIVYFDLLVFFGVNRAAGGHHAFRQHREHCYFRRFFAAERKVVKIEVCETLVISE